MLKELKDIVTLKKSDSPKTNIPVTKDYEEDRKLTYHQAGVDDSTRHFGYKTSLGICLQAIYNQYRDKVIVDTIRQEELNKPHREEKAKIEANIKGITVKLNRKKEKNETCQKKIADLEYEIADIPNNPKKYGVSVEKGSSAKFWIGLFLTIPIALYLFVFYISASYSTFFKQFEPGAGAFDSIFDPHAFVKAWKHGTLAGMFVTFIPFLFLGLGFLIHMFGEKKSIVNNLKITVLFIVTFVFDSILAYQIEKKLYDTTKTTDDPPFNINIAFQEVEFWGIIFAGFVAYIIFGLVFDFVMKEYKERDKIKMAIRERRDKIKIEEEKIEKIKDGNSILGETIRKYEGRIEGLNILIKKYIIPLKEYMSYASQYMQGWIEAVHQTVGPKDKTILIKECEEVYKQHIKDVKEDNSHQNKVFLPQA